MCWKAGEFTHLRRAQSTNRYTAHSTCDRSRDLTREQTGPSWEVEEAAALPIDMWRHLLETDGPIKTELWAKSPEITSISLLICVMLSIMKDTFRTLSKSADQAGSLSNLSRGLSETFGL